jgi:hypothetical protein
MNQVLATSRPSMAAASSRFSRSALGYGETSAMASRATAGK